MDSQAHHHHLLQQQQHLHQVPQAHSPSWQALYNDLQAAAAASTASSPGPAPQPLLQQDQQYQVPSPQHLAPPLQHLSQSSTASNSPMPPSAAILAQAASTPPAQHLQHLAQQQNPGPSPLATTPAAPPPTSGSTPQDFNSYLDFSSVQIDPAHPFSPPVPTSPFTSQQQHITASSSAASPVRSLSPAQQNQLQQLQHYHQLQNIQQQMNLLQQSNNPPTSPRSQHKPLRPNSQTLNILQNPETLDTFFRDFLDGYSTSSTLDSLMIDSTPLEQPAIPPADAASATSAPSPSHQILPPSFSPTSAMPPPTPTTLETQSAVMTNEIFRSPLAGPMDKSSTAGSTTTEDFTPLMSPAVTPFDSINPGIMPPTSDFTMPSSYFSGPPLVEEKNLVLPSSLKQPIPQLQQIQIQPPQPSGRRQRRGNSRKSTPVLAPMVSKSSTLSSSSSSSSASSTIVSSGPSARVTKASPMIRPSRRSSSNLPSLVSSTNTSPQIQPNIQPATAGGVSSSSSDHQTSWSSDSVSPEGLADIVMPPPQKRQPRKHETLVKQKSKSTPVAPAPSSSANSTPGLVPVTPASLMNLPEQKDVEMLDVASTELHLRNAVQAGKNVEKQEQQTRSSAKPSNGTPLARPSARKNSIQMSPKTIAPNGSATLAPSTSAGRRAGSRRGSSNKPMLPSPSLSAQQGSTLIKPKIAAATSSGGPNSSGSSAWKPRHGTSSSPVLRPKISPHISPRIDAMSGLAAGSGIHLSNGTGGAGPNGSANGTSSLSRKSSLSALNGSSASPTLSADISLVLASKSNYQNIVEGTHSQLGLSYPESLSADLTSKRTSHKLAEQGRRNRINSALTDLAKLLAPSHQASSKASTVEMAIDYIKTLHLEIADLKARLSKYEGGAEDDKTHNARDDDDDDDDDAAAPDDDMEDDQQDDRVKKQSQIKKTRSGTLAPGSNQDHATDPGKRKSDPGPDTIATVEKKVAEVK